MTHNLRVIVCDICGRAYACSLRQLTIDGDEDECVVDYLANLWMSPVDQQREKAAHDGWRSGREEVHRGWVWFVDRCPDCIDRPHPVGFRTDAPIEPKYIEDLACGNCKEDPGASPKDSQCPVRRYGEPDNHTVRCKYDLSY